MKYGSCPFSLPPRRTTSSVTSCRSGDPGNRADAARDLVLQLAGLEIVEVHLRRIVALRVPQHFVGLPEDLPLHARLHVRLFRSVNSVRTSPVVMSASLAVEFLWNRSVETKPSFGVVRTRGFPHVQTFNMAGRNAHASSS